MKKFVFGFMAFLSVVVASNAQAIRWPERLTDLPPTTLAQIAERAPGIELSAFRFTEYQPTIGNYGLVHYEAAGATVICEAGFRAGEADQDRFYITLYAEGNRVNFVTSYANYACPQD